MVAMPAGILSCLKPFVLEKIKTFLIFLKVTCSVFFGKKENKKQLVSTIEAHKIIFFIEVEIVILMGFVFGKIEKIIYSKRKYFVLYVTSNPVFANK